MTFTYTFTRTSVLVDQVDLFLKAAGIAEALRKPVVDAISERWLQEVGVFIEDDGGRVLEGALQISWSAHSDHADLSISTDLPGWRDGAAPELTVLAKRLREHAENKNLPVSFWVVFTKSIRDDPELYDVRRKKLGVNGPPPPWKKEPREQRIPLQDLPEAHVVLRDAR